MASPRKDPPSASEESASEGSTGDLSSHREELALPLAAMNVDLDGPLTGIRSAASEALLSPRQSPGCKLVESGVLWKSSGKRKEPGLFQKRFFKFIGGELQYHKTAKMTTAAGVISLVEVQNVSALPQFSSTDQNIFTFQVQTPARVYYLYSSTLEERDSWIVSIRQRVAEQQCKTPRVTCLLDGFLYKGSGNALVKELQRRHFTLQDGALSYYRPKQGMAAGVIPLAAVESIDVAEGLTRSKYMFTVTTAKRSYHLFVETEEEREEWVRALQDALAAHRQVADEAAQSGGCHGGDHLECDSSEELDGQPAEPSLDTALDDGEEDTAAAAAVDNAAALAPSAETEGKETTPAVLEGKEITPAVLEPRRELAASVEESTPAGSEEKASGDFIAGMQEGLGKFGSIVKDLVTPQTKATGTNIPTNASTSTSTSMSTSTSTSTVVDGTGEHRPGQLTERAKMQSAPAVAPASEPERPTKQAEAPGSRQFAQKMTSEPSILDDISEGVGKFGSMLVRNLIPMKKKDSDADQKEACREVYREAEPAEPPHTGGPLHRLRKGVPGVEDGEYWPYHVTIEEDELVFYKREGAVKLADAESVRPRKCQEESQFLFELKLRSSAERFCAPSGKARDAWVAALAPHVQPPQGKGDASNGKGLACHLSNGPCKRGFLALEELEELVRTTVEATPVEFFAYTWSNDARSLLERYHEERGDYNLLTDGWQPNEEWGHTQLVIYETPVVTPLKTSSSRLDEKFRYHLTQDRCLVESIGKLHSCPYADSFLVELRVEAKSNGDGTSLLVVSGGVHFVKSTIFKSKISDQTIKQSKASFEMWVRLARKELAECKQDASFGSDEPLEPAVLHSSWQDHEEALRRRESEAQAQEEAASSSRPSPLASAGPFVGGAAAAAVLAVLLWLLLA